MVDRSVPPLDVCPLALALALLGVLLAGTGAAQASIAPALDTLSLEHDGLVREYLLHVPAVQTGDLPLVLVLHGRGGSGPQMAELTGFANIADRHGFAVAFPSGVDGQWNYVDGVPGYDLPTDDAGFLRALVAEIAARHPVDASRVYLTGFSNGGFMTELLACTATDLFAAFASVAAAGFGGQPGVCGAPQPTALLLMHGTHDAVVPFAGLRQQGPNGPVTILASVEQTVSYWVDRLGCTNAANSETLPRSGVSPETEVRIVTMTGCPPGTALQLVAILGGGHNWPGHPGKLSEQIAGAVNQDIDASELIWEFLSSHTLENRAD